MRLSKRLVIILSLAAIAVAMPTALVLSGSIIGNSDWYGRPSILDRGDGVWVMIYREAATHMPDPDAVFHIRFSDDEGATWTADDTKLTGGAVIHFPISGNSSSDALADGLLMQAPNGDLLCHVSSNEVDEGDNPVGRLGTRQYRSTNGGLVWANDGQIETDETTDDEFLGAQDYFMNGSDVYITAFIDTDADYASPYKSVLYKSTNNGNSWSKVSDITSTAEKTNEAGIAYVGGSTIVSVIRDDLDTKTYERISTDMGASWGSLLDKTSQLSVFQHPVIVDYSGKLFLIGRDRIAADERYTVAYYSDDDGTTWLGKYYPDDTNYDDSGYCDLVRRSNGDLYVLSYAGTTTDADIMEYIFAFKIKTFAGNDGNILLADGKYICISGFDND